MTATEELRRLLDERGVERYEHEAPATDCIAFFDGRGWHDCWESVDGEVNVTFSMTPEQAIAATLGTGTCHDTGESRWFRCSECGFGMTDLYTDGDWSEEEQPKFCPNCGRRIVEPTRNNVEPTTLLPCPFCGGDAEVRYHPSCMRDPECRAWEVGCSICDARVGSTVYAIGKTKADAIAAWNRRAYHMGYDDALAGRKPDAGKVVTDG